MTKGISRLLAVTLLVGFLSACNNDPPTPERSFVLLMRASYPDTKLTDAELIRSGRQICGLFGQGLSRSQIVANIVSSGGSEMDAQTLANTATETLCVEYMSSK